MREDVADFYNWMHNDLQPLLDQEKNIAYFGAKLEADLDKVCVTGDNAGGIITLLSALNQPMGSIKACIATCPRYLDFESPRYLESISGVRMYLLNTPCAPPEMFESHIAHTGLGPIITDSESPSGRHLVLCQAQHDVLKPYFGTDEAIFPLKQVKDTEEGKFPYLLIIHGKDDNVNDVRYSEDFMKKAEKSLGKGRVALEVQDRGHGFVTELNLGTEWLAKALEKPTRIWLGEEKL